MNFFFLITTRSSSLQMYSVCKCNVMTPFHYFVTLSSNKICTHVLLFSTVDRHVVVHLPLQNKNKMIRKKSLKIHQRKARLFSLELSTYYLNEGYVL